MRGRVCLVVVMSSATASADDGIFQVRRLREAERAEPLLHLDVTTPAHADAEGGLVRREAIAIDIGSRLRLAFEGTSWQSGLAPSLFAEDLTIQGWRMSGELSYDLGPVRVGVYTSAARVGKATQRTTGLFVSRTAELSRWMHAWISVGVAHDEWRFDGESAATASTTVGFTLGTTFR